MGRSQFLQSLLVVLASILGVTESSAFHIIGGEITFECLGPGAIAGTNRYQFEMYIYRDCMAREQMAAPLDEFAQLCCHLKLRCSTPSY